MRRTVDRTALVGVLALVAGSLVLAVPTPAGAATETVSTFPELSTALDLPCEPDTVVVLDASISEPTQELGVACNLTLDLNGHDLAVRNLVIEVGLTLTDSSTGGTPGTLTADARGEDGMDGVQAAGTTFVVTGRANLTAFGGPADSGANGADGLSPGDPGDPGWDGFDAVVWGSNGGDATSGLFGDGGQGGSDGDPGFAGGAGISGGTLRFEGSGIIFGNGGAGGAGGAGGDGTTGGVGGVGGAGGDGAFGVAGIGDDGFLGGSGGAAGNGGNGGQGGLGGDGGAGGAGGTGIDGGTVTVLGSGAVHGTGGAGGSGGMAGEGGDGGNGGLGGNGGAGGEGGEASGGHGGPGGTAGPGGDGGDAGIGGNGGAGGVGGAGGAGIEGGTVRIDGSGTAVATAGDGGSGGSGGSAGLGGLGGLGGSGGHGGNGGTSVSGWDGGHGGAGATGGNGGNGAPGGNAGAGGAGGAGGTGLGGAALAVANPAAVTATGGAGGSGGSGGAQDSITAGSGTAGELGDAGLPRAGSIGGLGGSGGSGGAGGNRGGDLDGGAGGTDGSDGAAHDPWTVLQAQAISFTSTAPTDAQAGGSTYAVTATGGASGNPVLFSIAAGSTSVCSVAGSNVSFHGAGTCEIRANQAGDGTYAAAPQVSQSFPVAAPPPPKISQTITFTSAPPVNARIGDTYDVAATGGGSGNPVVFTVAGAACSIAGAQVTFEAVGECEVTASQAGNAGYFAAPPVSQSITVGVLDPTITAEILSKVPVRQGWYREPVRVVFTCAEGSAPLTAPCPKPVRLRKNGADQSVSRSITAADGGTAAVTVEGINIDRKAPRVKVIGVKRGRTYSEERTVRCEARDGLSGPERCRVTTRVLDSAGPRTKVGYTAVGRDVAGNKRVVEGWYWVRR